MTPPPFYVSGVECRVCPLARDTWAWFAAHLCGTATTETKARDEARKAAEGLVVRMGDDA